jgi:2',3'-cyclic-nucleotide 2'-phosphodiesterase (5'-nucleotidase family)
VVGDHDHLLLQEAFLATDLDGRPVPIVQAGEFYEHIGELVLDVKRHRVKYVRSTVVPVDARVPRAPDIAAVVKAARGEVKARFLEWSGGAFKLDMFHQPVALATRTLKRSVEGDDTNARDTALGNLTADALRHAGRTDVGVTVSGFVEGEIARGFVVPEDLFGVVCDGLDPTILQSDEHLPGLGFPVMTFEMTGADFVKAIEVGLTQGGDFLPQVSGMTLPFDSSKQFLERVDVANVTIGGLPLDPDRTYTFTTNLGVIIGLTELLAPFELAPQNVTPAGTYELFAMIDWASRNVFLDYRTEGRIRDLALTAQ